MTAVELTQKVAPHFESAISEPLRACDMKVVTLSLEVPMKEPRTVMVVLPSVGDVLGETCDTVSAASVTTMTTQRVELRFPKARSLLSVARRQKM